MTLLLQERPRKAEAGSEISRGRVAQSDDCSPFRDRFFSGTVQSLLGRLSAVARRIVDDEELAGDAVQEALLSLWLEAEMPANPHAWLVRAVSNRSLHLARGRSRRRKHEEIARRARSEASDRDDPSGRVEAAEWAQVVTESLDRLDADQRAILILSLVDELDYQSIATVLDIPIGTVRSRLSRARQALRNVLINSSRIHRSTHAIHQGKS